MFRIASRASVAAIAPLFLFHFFSTEVQGTIHTVNAQNFSFSPTKTVVQVGDTVRWMLVGGLHSSVADLSSPKQWSGSITGSPSTTVRIVISASDGPGPFPYHCGVHPLSMKDTIFVAPPPCSCGDADGSGVFDVSDAVFLINFIFNNGPTPSPICRGDADGSNDVNVSDAVYLVNFIFNDGPDPHCPG